MPLRLPSRMPTERKHISQLSKFQRYKRKLSKFLLQSYRLPSPFASSPISSLPIKFRPIILAICFLAVLLLLVLGVHPSLSSKLKVNDKIQHFIGLALSTGLFYFIFEVEDASRRVIWYRLLPEIATVLVCFIGGGIVSEFMQSLLPYKTFQVWDVVANLLGCSVGLFVARTIARRMRHRRELAELYQPLDAMDISDEEAAIESVPNQTSSRPEMSESPTLQSHKKAKVQDVWREEDSDYQSTAGDLTADELDEEIRKLEGNGT